MEAVCTSETLAALSDHCLQCATACVCVCVCVSVRACAGVFVEEIRGLSSLRSACCVAVLALAGGTRSAVDASFNWIKLVEQRI
jgi:hypothetical protein